MRRADGALLLALLLPIFAIAPLVQHAGLPNTADGIIHLLRQVDFDRAFRAGALVPRWGADLYGGFGYPLYIFAPPLFAYGVEAFFLPGMAMDDALKLVTIAILELYSLGMFLFMRPKVGRWGALAAAALNVYAPLRMREALVTGGNYPQFLALALFPLVLWAFDGLLRTQRRVWVVAAGVCAAALVLSHLFHAMIFVPVAAGYVLLRLVVTRAPRQVWGLVLAAGALALLFSAFFWLPTLAERSLTRTAAEIYIRSSDFHQRFLSWARLLAPPLPLDLAEANADVPLALGWAQMAAAALAVAGVIWSAARTRRGRLLAGGRLAPSAEFAEGIVVRTAMQQTGCLLLVEPLWWLAVLAASIYLQLPASAPIWENVSLLPVAEFPWRFMGLSAFALAVLGGYAGGRELSFVGATPAVARPQADTNRAAASPAPTNSSSESWRAMLLSTLVVVAAVVTSLPYTYTPRGFVRLGTPSPTMVLEYEKTTGAYGLTTINEYLPQTVLELPKDLPAAISRPKIDLPAAAIRSAQWSPLGESDSVTLALPMQVRFRTFNYPGWSVSVDGKPAPLTTLRDGTFTVGVPAGEHQLSARFDETALRLAANAISLAGVMGLVAVGLWKAARRKPATEVAPGKPDGNADGVPLRGRSAAGPQGATHEVAPQRSEAGSVASLAVVPETGHGHAHLPRVPGGGAPYSRAKRSGFCTSSTLCLLILALFLTKTFVVDPQGLLRVSRFAQAVAVFEGQVELLGGESDSGAVARGGDVHARFYWRPAQALTKDYHVFAQLIGADGSAIAGSDKQHPGDPVVQGETPTSQIAPGTYLRDEHIIHVPSDAPPGRYELKVGLYDPQTGKRLKLPSGESMAGVGVIELK